MDRTQLDRWEREFEEKRVYYVYLHTDPATGEVFYVGKGKSGRAWAYTRQDRTYSHAKRLQELIEAGCDHGSWVSLLKTGLTEAESIHLESTTIHHLLDNGQPLLNVAIPLRPTQQTQ